MEDGSSTSLVQMLVELQTSLPAEFEYGCKQAVENILNWLSTLDSRFASLRGMAPSGGGGDDGGEKERRKRLAAERQKAMLDAMR